MASAVEQRINTISEIEDDGAQFLPRGRVYAVLLHLDVWRLWDQAWQEPADIVKPPSSDSSSDRLGDDDRRVE